jgi:hypothetical protein
MAQKGDDDEDVNDLISHFEMLTCEQMKKALDIAKVTLKNKEKEEKVKEREEEMKSVVGSPPKHILLRLNGNSVEKIAELEMEYDFTDLSVKEREEAKKWYNADQPSSSRMYGPTVTSAYRLWLKWNLTSTGGKAPYYKGDLVKKREEEAETESGAAMAAAMEVAAAVGAAMAGVKLE